MFKKLLIPLDRSPLAEQAVGQAAAIARAASAEMDVVLVHQPLPFAGFKDVPWNEDEWTHEHRYIETIADELASGAGVSVTHAVMRGEASEMICKRAREVEADLIVMTSHGRTGLSRAWLGSIATSVLRHSTIPVLMLRPVATKWESLAAHHLFKHMLVPLDGSAFAADILISASALARCAGARVTLLRVVQPVPLALAIGVDMGMAYPPIIADEEATNLIVSETKDQLAEVGRRLVEQGRFAVDVQVVVATSVARAILDFVHAHDVDVIAMSTHGRGASRLIMGSVTDKILRGAGVPMLLHRPVGVELVSDAHDASLTGHALPLVSA